MLGRQSQRQETIIARLHGPQRVESELLRTSGLGRNFAKVASGDADVKFHANISLQGCVQSDGCWLHPLPLPSPMSRNGAGTEPERASEHDGGRFLVV